MNVVCASIHILQSILMHFFFECPPMYGQLRGEDHHAVIIHDSKAVCCWFLSIRTLAGTSHSWVLISLLARLSLSGNASVTIPL